MLASLSVVGGVVLSKHLDVIVPRILETLRSDEGVQVGSSVSSICLFIDLSCLFICLSICLSVCLSVISAIKVHYSSSVIPFLDFEEGPCDDNMADDSQLSLEDDGDIEGCVGVYVGVATGIVSVCDGVGTPWRMPTWKRRRMLAMQLER